MNNSVIPIIYACDDNIIKYLYVSVFSLLENKNENTFYDIFFLISKDVKNENKNLIEKLCSKYNEVSCHFIVMNDEFSNARLEISHITTPAYYRLLSADLLPKKYKKAIYLDYDTIIEKDLTEFFKISLDENYAAGVVAIGIVASLSNREYFEKVGITDLYSYINSGVMLLNLEKIRNDNMTKHLCNLVEQNLKLQDQGIINLAFKGKVKVIDLKYNFMEPYINDLEENINKCNVAYDIYGKHLVENARKNPVIIHYLNNKKLWSNKRLFYSVRWWAYANKSPLKFKLNFDYYRDIIFSYKTKNNHIVLTILGIKFKKSCKRNINC